MTKRIEINGHSYALPFVHLFRPLTTVENDRLRTSIARHGVRSPVVTYSSHAHGRALLDGLNRSAHALDLGLDSVPVLSLGHLDDRDARELAISLNADRRHLSPEEQQAARDRRLARVLLARAAGDTLRTIAAAENLSHEQVRRDLTDATVTGVTTPLPRRRLRPLATRAHNAALRLAAQIRRLLAGSHRKRLRDIAASYACPFDGKTWPALDTLTAVLRDLAHPGYTA